MAETMNDWIKAQATGAPAAPKPVTPPRPANAHAGAGAGVPNVAPMDGSAVMNALIYKALRLL